MSRAFLFSSMRSRIDPEISARGMARALRRAALELILACAGFTLYGQLLSANERRRAVIALAAGIFGALVGLIRLHRSGALALALRCPRLDALKLRIGSAHAPWTALRAADNALRALDEDARGYRDFFPEAHADLLSAATRALELHGRKSRAERALAQLGAPEDRTMQGGAVLLREEIEREERELRHLAETLRELRLQLIAATLPQHSMADPIASLEELKERSIALGESARQMQIGARSGT